MNSFSKKNFIQNVDRLVIENGVEKLSVILNVVEQDRGSYGYGNAYGNSYGGGYGYGYGGYYEDEPVEKKGLLARLFESKN